MKRHGLRQASLRVFLGAQFQVQQGLKSESHGIVSVCGRTYRRHPMVASAPQRKYRIERYLAEGGMGAIYIGKKIGAGGFEKEVVLKQLLPEFTERPEFRDLFFREAKISASLDHVNIVRTFDLVSSEDSLFIVMEYVRGADLRTISWRARLKRKALSPSGGAARGDGDPRRPGLRPRPPRAQNGAPLGIIHRDVSPSNILCSGSGRGEAVGLRHRQGHHLLVGVLPGARQGRVHVARAGAEQAPRRPQRSVLAGGVHLRDADRRAAVRRRSADAARGDLRPGDPPAVAEAPRSAAARWRG